MTTLFISFPPGGGGNHLRNMIAVNSNFIQEDEYRQSIIDQYKRKTINVHGKDLAQNVMASNLNSFKLHRALMNPAQNYVFFGHFAEIMTLRNDIAKIADKKFILLSIDTDKCRKIWLARSAELAQEPYSYDYYLGEQVFLYESFMYSNNIFQCKSSNVMNIGIGDWFSHNVETELNRVSQFLNCTFDLDQAKDMHNTWLEKNSKFL